MRPCRLTQAGVEHSAVGRIVAGGAEREPERVLDQLLRDTGPDVARELLAEAVDVEAIAAAATGASP